MVAVAILGVALAMPGPMATTGVILVVLAVPALLISLLPPRVRLAVESSILLALLVFMAFQSQSRFYAGEADRAAGRALCASDWAAPPRSPRARAILRREAAWFSRRAVTLRGKALWEGLIHGPTYPSGRLSRRDHRRLLDLLWEMQRHAD